jgi:hypothetical protein
VDFTCNTAKMFSFGPNPTREKKAWSSSTCLLYVITSCLNTLYKAERRDDIPLLLEIKK